MLTAMMRGHRVPKLGEPARAPTPSAPKPPTRLRRGRVAVLAGLVLVAACWFWRVPLVPGAVSTAVSHNAFVQSLLQSQFLPETPLDPQQHRVDVVYTWVNASDPLWQAAYLATAATWAASHPDADFDADAKHVRHKYRDWDELRYSLRSVLAHGSDWLGTIYLVTAGHAPSWLDVTHPRIRLVRHEQLMTAAEAARFLPTFNSNVIESFVHRIHGLSNLFLYFNNGTGRAC